MEQVIVAGMPAAQEQRLRAHIKANPQELHPGFTLKWFASSGPRAGLAMARRDGLLRLADQYTARAILIVSQKPTDETESLRNSVQPHFRCRTLTAEILQLIYPQPSAALPLLNSVLQEEALWAQKLRPSNVAHPLLLPEGVFQPEASFRDAWRAAATAASETQIRDVAKYVRRFGDAHRTIRQGGSRGKVYRSQQSQLWDYRGAAHATPPFPRTWKYSYEIPSGFHYDVTDERKAAFKLVDTNRVLHSVAAGKHINIDCHGWSR